MGRAVITEQRLSDIADAIRGKTGGQNAMTPAEMAAAIEGMETTPAYLYDDSTYPEHMEWPYSTMRKCQFYSYARPAASDQFFHTIDLGTLREVPERAFMQGLGMYSDQHPLTAVTGLKVLGIHDYAFNSCTSLATLNCPRLQAIYQSGLCCTAITDLPQTVRVINGNGMRRTPVTVLDLPNLKTIGKLAFCECANFTTLKLKAIETIAAQALQDATNFANLVLDIGETAPLPTLENVNAFANTKITTLIDTAGHIYITDSRLSELRGATNWSSFGSYAIKPLSEYNP